MPEDFRWILGLDIGGTNVVVGLVPMQGGKPAGLRRLPTLSEEGGEAVVRRSVAAAEACMAEVLGEGSDFASQVAGVGIGAPGPLDRKTGILLEAPNLGWRNFPLQRLVSDGLGLPAALDNDANCATYGEWWMGAGRGSKILVGLTLGTGIGGGWS